MKRIISFILVIGMLSATIALATACAKKETEKKPSGNQSTVEPQEDNYMVGQYDFEGEVITFPSSEASLGILT